MGEARDFQRVLACDILLDALMGGNESPIKRAILDAGLGGDATAYLLDSQAQPVAMFQLRNANDGAARPFMIFGPILRFVAWFATASPEYAPEASLRADVF